MRQATRTREIGVTLIELLTVICIIGILAAFSYPMFAEQAAKGRRAQARALMYEVLQHEEKFFTENNTYTVDLTAACLPESASDGREHAWGDSRRGTHGRPHD